jgi:hypothetical protein
VELVRDIPILLSEEVSLDPQDCPAPPVKGAGD